MQITTYNFAKEPNSTKQPAAGGAVHNVVLKEPCSLFHPVFRLNGFSHSDNYVKWGSRYYFIEDIIQVTNSEAEYHCREDVLATYKSYIGSSSQYITRSAHAYTTNLPDGKYPLLSVTTQETIPFTTLAAAARLTGGCFVIGINNGENAAMSGGVSYYVISGSTFRALMAYMYSDVWLDQSGQSITVALQKELINPMQYIASVMYIPLAYETVVVGTITQTIKFGWWDSGITGGAISTSSPLLVLDESVTFSAHPQAAARGNYMNGRPFTEMWLSCWCFGNIPVDPSFFIISKTLQLVIDIDLITGIANLIIQNNTSGAVCSKHVGQFGVPVQISQIRESITGAATSIIGAGVSASYGNYVGVGAGILSAIESLMPQLSTGGSVGSRSVYAHRPELHINRRNAADDDNTHLGRPLCVRGTVQSYPGFLQVENADIDFACNYTELTEIKSALESGIYYE